MAKKKHGFWESFYVDKNKDHPSQQIILNYFILTIAIVFVIFLIMALLNSVG